MGHMLLTHHKSTHSVLADVLCFYRFAPNWVKVLTASFLEAAPDGRGHVTGEKQDMEALFGRQVFAKPVPQRP